MAEARFNQVNLVVGDMERTLAFYRLAGLDVGGGVEWPAGTGWRHAASGDDDLAALEFDNEPFVRVWARDAVPPVTGPVIGLRLDSGSAVDETFGRLVAAGHRGVQPPYDAFWGARYAVVEDPDGHAVGLMGPRDPSRRYVPEVGE